jgi:two-component system chemotaxis response regulator CheB
LIAIILSGANSDGAKGMEVIAREDGEILVQDPSEAIVSFMPEQAIHLTGTSNIFTTEMIVKFLNDLDS